MLMKLVPVLSVVVGLLSGAVAAVVFPGLAFEQGPEPEEASTGETPGPVTAEAEAEATEVVKLANQFFIPVMGRKSVKAMVVLSLAIELPVGNGALVHETEPKLRDAFLSELFDLAAAGGFEDPGLSRRALDLVRKALENHVRDILGFPTAKVLVMDMTRQNL